jgi:hypothetical protein
LNRWGHFAFFLLSLQATWFAALAAIVGLWFLLRKRSFYLVWSFTGFALLGALGQWFSSQGFIPKVTPPDYLVVLSDGEKNPISSLLYELSGWNQEDGNRREARRVDQGFWRVPRYSSSTGREYVEYLTGRWYPVSAGRTYTQSFYLRHEGTSVDLTITFFTQKGHHLVPTKMESVAPGVWRVWGSYTAKEGDQAVRAIDFISGGGDFTYLDVGWPQLEEGSIPTAYRPGEPDIKGIGWRLQWWVGIALMGFLVFHAGFVLFRQVEVSKAALMLLVGLGVHLAYVVWQWFEAGAGRVSGLTPQPNFLGHLAVMVAGLVWVLGGGRLGALALGIAACMVWFSGSRTAFWGLLLLAGAWGWNLGSRRWVALGLAVLLGGLAILQPEFLGRFSQALVLDNNAQARLQFWLAALQAFQAYPLGGVGFGNFNLYFDLNPPANVVEYSPAHVHNVFFHLLAEGGVLALLAFVWWLLGVVLVVWRARAWRVLTVFLVAMVLNIFDFSFFTAWVYYPLILAVAFAKIPR